MECRINTTAFRWRIVIIVSTQPWDFQDLQPIAVG